MIFSGIKWNAPSHIAQVLGLVLIVVLVPLFAFTIGKHYEDQRVARATDKALRAADAQNASLTESPIGDYGYVPAPTETNRHYTDADCKADVPAAREECAYVEFAAADQNLAKSYTSVLTRAGELDHASGQPIHFSDRTLAKKLWLSQQAWAAYREQECRTESTYAGISTSTPTLFYACATYLSNKRIGTIEHFKQALQ